jgi:glycosyltransferase involved in cell wall biosynthesis
MENAPHPPPFPAPRSPRPRILFVNVYMHAKNLNAITQYKNIDLDIVSSPLELSQKNIADYRVVYSPAVLLDVQYFPNTFFIFGPHYSVFPNQQLIKIAGYENVVYLQPSDWARDTWRGSMLCRKLRIETLPFGVDTEKFAPIASHDDIAPYIPISPPVFIYFKRRHPLELDAVCDYLRRCGISYKVFNYVDGYKEENYIEYLKHAKYGIWLGSHESQGFALLEALSCNVPLLVWNVTSMSQEYGTHNPNIPATTIPYWDERCGEHFTMFYDMEKTHNTFLANCKTEKYRPREYVLENLTMEKCEARLIEMTRTSI